MLAFTVNRLGQRHDFFYQKQIETVMAYSSFLTQIGHFKGEDESSWEKLEARNIDLMRKKR
jgi:hypothetical protein